MLWLGCAPEVKEDLSAQCSGGGHHDFTTSKPYVPGTLEVYLFGILQGVPPTYWTESGVDTFHTVDALDDGDTLTVCYQPRA